MKLLNVLLDFSVYEGSQVTNDPADTIKLLNRIEGVQVSQCSRTQMQIAGGGSYSPIPILSAGGSYLLISADQPINLKMNSGSEVLALTPKANGTKTFLLYLKGTISAVSIAVPGSTAANVDVIVAKV